MTEKQKRPKFFRNHLNEVCNLTDVQALIGTVRWVAKRKFLVAAAIKAGVLTVAEASAMFQLQEFEINLWLKTRVNHGVKGMQVTKSQKLKTYR